MDIVADDTADDDAGAVAYELLREWVRGRQDGDAWVEARDCPKIAIERRRGLWRAGELSCNLILETRHDAPLPSHVCYETMRASVEQWERRTFLRELHPASFSWQMGDAWPWPASAGAFAQWRQRSGDGLESVPLLQLGLGIDWIGLVVVRGCKEWTVTLLGPVSSMGFTPDGDLTPIRFLNPLILTRAPRLTEPVKRAVRDLDRWYTKLLLRKSVTGRPVGSGMPVTAENVEREYRDWVATRGKPPTQDDPAFTRRFSLEPRQFKERLRHLRENEGFSWAKLRVESSPH